MTVTTPISDKTVFKYSGSPIVRKGLLRDYDGVLFSDLDSFSLTTLNTRVTTLPANDPSSGSLQSTANAKLFTITLTE